MKYREAKQILIKKNIISEFRPQSLRYTTTFCIHVKFYTGVIVPTVEMIRILNLHKDELLFFFLQSVPHTCQEYRGTLSMSSLEVSRNKPSYDLKKKGHSVTSPKIAPKA